MSRSHKVFCNPLFFFNLEIAPHIHKPKNMPYEISSYTIGRAVIASKPKGSPDIYWTSLTVLFNASREREKKQKGEREDFRGPLRGILTSFVDLSLSTVRKRVAMGIDRAIRVFLLIMLFLSSVEHTFSIHEDQVGLMDW